MFEQGQNAHYVATKSLSKIILKLPPIILIHMHFLLQQKLHPIVRDPDTGN